MDLIVAADNNWAIGRENELLIRIPEDMKYFRRLTEKNVVVMGRKTLESFPGGKALPNRVNIVLTRQSGYDGKGAVVVHNEEELRTELENYREKQIFIIGGESIYRLLLPFCEKAYVTCLDYMYEADTWMPDLDKAEGWVLEEVGEEQTCFDLIYHFNIYRNTSPLPF
ncbi:MAG: dihydrofolate reductase [Clostridiales bacterium]|nr:dihydrofolate reductase [Clostridiales bacterium]